VSYGRSCPEGFLPVYSVDTEEEAKMLLIAACDRGLDGQFVARELLHEQTIPNLLAFGERLHSVWLKIKLHQQKRTIDI